jgi:hypothetical protein
LPIYQALLSDPLAAETPSLKDFLDEQLVQAAA